jgi:hypothetical protein
MPAIPPRKPDGPTPIDAAALDRVSGGFFDEADALFGKVKAGAAGRSAGPRDLRNLTGDRT